MPTVECCIAMDSPAEPKTAVKVAIVDYELANMFSVARACAQVGLDPVITSDPDVLAIADAVILPGVGAFNEAMINLNRLGLVSPIKSVVDSGKPFLGICLGMQLLFSESEEFGATTGLDILQGRVVRFPSLDGQGNPLRVPQIGWNRICQPPKTDWEGTPLVSTAHGEFMYFMHSYYVVPDAPEVILSMTEYEGIEYCSGVARRNVVGLQFHPEKSACRGIAIYEAFARQISESKSRAW